MIIDQENKTSGIILPGANTWSVHEHLFAQEKMFGNFDYDSWAHIDTEKSLSAGRLLYIKSYSRHH